jgi:hypothetical protein
MRRITYFGILLAVFLAVTPVLAYDHGGKTAADTTPEVGAVFSMLTGSNSFSASSNVVNVKTIRIISATTNFTVVDRGDAPQVTLRVRNTGTSIANVTTAELRLYKTGFQNIPATQNPEAYRIDTQNAFVITAPAVPLTIAAGGESYLTFTVQVTTNLIAFQKIAYNPVVIDGLVQFDQPPVYSDSYWASTKINNSQYYQYASEVTANWDLTGPPHVISIAVSPNPTRINPVVITVNFSEAMNVALPASINYRFNGVTRDITGSWYNSTTWVGGFTIPAGTVYEGLATVAALLATSNSGEAMIPSYNVGQFEIDTIKPTASLSMGVSTSIAAFFPVTFIATDILRTTPNMRLSYLLNGGGSSSVNVMFLSSINQVTWNCQVIVPGNALANSIATFNIVGFYIDNAGNTNNVLINRTTINVLTAIPVISTVNFDSYAGYPGINISSQPFISLFVIDYRKITPNIAIDASTIRVTVDGALVNCAPYSVTLYSSDTLSNVYQIDFNFPYTMSEGNHTFTFGLSDGGSPAMAAFPYVIAVNVGSSELELVDRPVPFPNPFSPDGDGDRDITEIVYNLTKRADITIYIYDLNGDIVWRKDISAGDVGGRPGINRVVWTGEATFGRGEVLPNGIYICHIIAEIDGEKRSLGRTKIYILK